MPERTLVGKRPGLLRPKIHEDDIKCYNAYGEVGPRLDPEGEQTKPIEGDAKLDGRGFASLECESPFAANAAIGRCTVSWRAEVTSVEGQTRPACGWA
jgi:hypothetical protein